MVKNAIKKNDLILDISQYNIIHSYSKVKNLCSAAILRIGYRGYGGGTIVKDKLFSKHLDNLIDELPLGVYFLDQSINENEAILQANWTYIEFMNAGLGATPIPIWIDSETSASLSRTGRGDLISKEQRTNNILAFCNRMNELGYNAGIYASDSWMKDKLIYDRMKHLPVWNAKYNSNNGLIGKKPSNRADLHQFTSKYVTDFCNNPLDMSIVLNDDIFKKDTFEQVTPDPTNDSEFYPIPEFTLNECLTKIGLGTDKETKRKIALANGQPNYTGARNQNLKMLEWLKAGTLKKF